MTNEQRFHHAAEEFARRIVEMVVETKDDLPFDDNDTIYDICIDTIKSFDLNDLIRAKIRHIVNVRGS